jgi:hypothetical protein
VPKGSALRPPSDVVDGVEGGSLDRYDDTLVLLVLFLLGLAVFATALVLAGHGGEPDSVRD